MRLDDEADCAHVELMLLERFSGYVLFMCCSLDGMMCTRLHVKGAAEIILDLCTQQVSPASALDGSPQLGFAGLV